MRAYYRVLRYYTGLNFFWVIDNNADVSSAMDRISKKGNARKIPHNKLLQCLQFFIDLVFNDKDRKYLCCTDSGAHWVSGARSVDRRYSKDSVSSALKFLIENAYFEVGGKFFQQKIGIPIGLDPAPFLANLFLAYYEIH